MKNITNCLLNQNFGENKYCVLHPNGEKPIPFTKNNEIITRALNNGNIFDNILL